MLLKTKQRKIINGDITHFENESIIIVKDFNNVAIITGKVIRHGSKSEITLIDVSARRYTDLMTIKSTYIPEVLSVLVELISSAS